MTHPLRPTWPFPRIIAHRGGGTLAPENTQAGLRAAAEYGFEGVEFDAKLTRDGVVILMHDDTLNRTTNARGRVAQADWVALRTLDAGSWYEARFANETIPTLETALSLCDELSLWPNVEIKPCPGREWETGALVARQVLRQWRREPFPLLSSFSPLSLEGAREEAPRLLRGLLMSDVADDWSEQVSRAGCFSLHCHHRAARRTLLVRTVAADIPMLCYTVNHAALARKLMARGVSAIVTDRLDLIPPGATL